MQQRKVIRTTLGELIVAVTDEIWLAPPTTFSLSGTGSLSLL
jgi:hypothetical protein